MTEGGVVRRLDYLTLGLMAVLSLIGLYVIRAASVTLSILHDKMYFVDRQVIWFVVGSIVLAVLFAIPYTTLAKWSRYIYWVMFAMLAFVLVKGHSALGASRWIGTQTLQIQPSEIAKVMIIVTLADHLTRKPSLKRWRDLFSPLVHVGIPMALIIKQPDLGTALVFLAILVAMLYMAGAPGWKLLILFGGGLGLAVFWIYAHLHLMIGHHHIPIPMHNYQLNRLISFVNPNADPLGTGYNVIQSRVAVGTGGLYGLHHVTSNSQLAFLPESYTDFIFAVLANQMGFVGAVAVLFLYFLMIARGLFIAAHARDRLGALMATGVVAMIGFHVLENAGMATGIMPVAGVPLPFMSYGGSAFMADAGAIGLLLNVWARREGLVFRVGETRPVVQKPGA
ncbi:MAG: rod shape-determining protein RodA [Clostridia bacterium]